MRKFLLSIACVLAAVCAAQATEIPRDSVPEDHLAWLGFRGPVKEVVEYNYGSYGKTVYRFDEQGRLLEYIDYISPFAGSGGCVFGLYEHFRYAYDKKGRIQFLETYNADNEVVDDYADLTLELFPKQNKDADLFNRAEKEFGDTTYCFGKWTPNGDNMHYLGRRFDRYGNWFETVSANLEDECSTYVRVREITYYNQEPKSTNPRLSSLDILPKGCNEKTAFWLDFNFQGYVFEGLLYPLHEGRWIVLSHWCLDEEETIYRIDEPGAEPVPAASLYKDPFEGIKYPVIQTDSVSFGTRNYGGKTLPLYQSAKGKAVAAKLNVECSLDVLDANPATRRVYCRTNPNDWMWGEPENEEEKEWKHPYISVIGWVDEVWICANLLSTCP